MVLLVPLNPDPSEATDGLEPKAVLILEEASEKKPEPAKKSYEIRNITSKGMGLFATRDISVGELILREKPMIVMPKKVFDDDDSNYIECWLDRKILQLSSEQREVFYSLADSRQFDGETKTSLGVFYTNDMTFTDDSAALFPVMARANHSCVPNADFVSRDHLGVQDLVAVSPIKKDEEITLCYLPSSGEGSEVKRIRQSYTRKWYGFQCCCLACTLKGSAFDDDERLRETVRTLQSLPIDSLSLDEIEELIDSLIRIGTKLPYLTDVASLAFERALKSNNKVLAAKFFAAGYTASSIVGETSESEKNRFQFVLESQMVEIGGELFLFNP